jgi:hypothetical protein
MLSSPPSVSLAQYSSTPLLILAVDDERDRLVELEEGAAVQRRVGLTVELEGDGHHAALRGPVPLSPYRVTLVIRESLKTDV